MPGRRVASGLVFAVAAAGMFLAAVDQTLVATALSTIIGDFRAPIEWGSWTITVFALGQVLVMPVAGRLSDLYGAKPVFLVGVLLFAGGSLACGLAGSIGMLIVCRAVAALGAGSFFPTLSAIVAATFGANRDRALGLFTGMFPFGAVVGPILGGLVVTYWSWRGVFLVEVPIGLVIAALAWLCFPATAARRPGRFDWRGLLLLGLCLMSGMLVFAFIGGGGGLGRPLLWVLALVAIGAFALLVRHTRRTVSPFIAGHLVVGRRFVVANLLSLLYGISVVGFSPLVPLYAQLRYGIPPLESGLVLTSRALGMIALTALTTVALRRIGLRLPLLAGFAALAVGLGMLSLDPPSVPPLGWLLIASAVTGLGMGMAIPPTTNAGLEFAPDEVAGVSGLRGMLRQAGSIISVSVVSAVMARSADPGVALGWSFFALGVLLLLALPFIRWVPEHRGSW